MNVHYALKKTLMVILILYYEKKMLIQIVIQISAKFFC